MRASLIHFERLELRQLLSAIPFDSLATTSPAAPPATTVASAASQATPLPSAGGRAFTEYAAVRFTAKIGEFHFKTVDQFLSAVIHWSDGTHSVGNVVGSYATGEWYVQGTHTYAKTGVYKVNVNVYARLPGQPHPLGGPINSFTSVVTVNELKPSNGGENLIETATQSFTTMLGEFQYKTIDQLLNAVIYWGDGSHSAGTLVGSYATGKWYVQGTHTYSLTGTYKVDVKIFGRPAGSTFQPTSPLAQFTSVIKVMGHA